MALVLVTVVLGPDARVVPIVCRDTDIVALGPSQPSAYRPIGTVRKMVRNLFLVGGTHFTAHDTRTNVEIILSAMSGAQRANTVTVDDLIMADIRTRTNEGDDDGVERDDPSDDDGG